MELSDATLVEQTLEGDIEAFGKLVTKYQSAIYALAFHRVGNSSDAQDLAQDAFIRAFEKLTDLQEPAKFASWLKRITTNLCRDWQRRPSPDRPWTGVQVEDAHSLPDMTPGPEEITESRELERMVREGIASLPRTQQCVVTLHYLEGLPVKEIADFLGIPTGTVESRLHRAREQLRENLAMIESALFRFRLEDDFAPKLMQEAHRLSRERQGHPRVVQLCQQVLKTWPNSQHANSASTLMGEHYLLMGQLDRAIRVYEEALGSAQGQERLHCRYYLGKAYYQRKEYANALTHYEFIGNAPLCHDDLTLITERTEWVFRLAGFYSAQCLEKLGRLTDAHTSYQRLLQRFPTGEMAFCAMNALRRLVSPRNLSDVELQEVHQLLERCHYLAQQGMYPRAIDACEWLIYRFPSVLYAAETQTLIGRCHQQCGETGRAIEAFQKELACYAQRGSRCRFAQAYEAHGDATQAREHYAKALAEYQVILQHYPDARPSDLRQAWQGSGNCYKRLGYLEKAEVAYQTAFDIRGEEDSIT